MGAYNQPTILPYQPSFLERMAPALLHTAAQFGMQKLGQDWQASQKKIDKEHENRKVMLKGLMDNTLRVAKSKQAAPSSGGLGQAVAPQEQAERPQGVPFGGQVYEPCQETQGKSQGDPGHITECYCNPFKIHR